MTPRSSTRSLHVTAQALTLVLAGVLIHTVWRNTGSRLAIVTEVALAAALGGNLAWSAWTTGRVTVTVLELPADATAGDGVRCEIDVRGPSTPISLRMISSPRAQWFRVEPDERGGLSAIAGSRGVATAAVFEISSTAPIGLVGLNRRIVVDLPHPLHVGPRPEPVPELSLPPRRMRSSAEDDVRGTRPWAPGDPLRRVHWPTVARTGTLSVREHEPPPSTIVHLALDLEGGGRASEAAASRAAWIAIDALRQDHRVLLSTVEATGPATGAVRSPLEVSRRLAAAVRSQVAPVAPAKPRPGDVVVWITASGDRLVT